MASERPLCTLATVALGSSREYRAKAADGFDWEIPRYARYGVAAPARRMAIQLARDRT